MTVKMIDVFARVLRESVEELRSGGEKNSKYLWNHFSKSESEFVNSVKQTAAKFLGKDFQKEIESAHSNKPGSIDQALKKLWKNNFSDYEALLEVGFWYDVAQNNYGGSNNSAYEEAYSSILRMGTMSEPQRKKRCMSPEDFSKPGGNFYDKYEDDSGEKD